MERARIEEEAALFVVRFAGTADPERSRAAEEWISQGPIYAMAFARAEAAWAAAERLRAAPPPITPEAVAGPAGHFEAIFTGRRVMSALATASIAAALLTVAIEKVTAVDRYRTEIGEQRTVTLADGSHVRLNTATTVEVSLRETDRSVHVLDGEALFDVAPDAHRPFYVRANGSEIRALGTRFNVRIRPQFVELTVTHGAVAVRDGKSGVERVAAGDSAAIRDGLVAQTAIGGGALRQRIAWTDGVIDLRGASLDQAVEEFNRYRVHPIVIGDPRLAAMPVAGRYHTTDSDRFITALEQQFSVRAVSAADRSILLVEPNPLK